MIEAVNRMMAGWRGGPLLVGVSGGADSVALLHLLVRAGLDELVVCHLDHGLRGGESREDARFVEALAARLGLAVETGAADVRGIMEECGESMETAARRARHGFFAECGRKRGCNRVALGHHGDDQAETVLWNLMRGSRGASGMRAAQVLVMAGREMTVLRPLLDLRGAELRRFLRAENLDWREDATNVEPVAVRNRLRHEVLPLLGEITGRDVVRAFSKAAESGSELRAVEAWAVARAAVVDPAGRVHLPKLGTLPAGLQRACVADFLRNAGVGGIDRGLIGRVMKVAAGGGALDLPGGARVRRRQGRLVLER